MHIQSVAFENKVHNTTYIHGETRQYEHQSTGLYTTKKTFVVYLLEQHNKLHTTMKIVQLNVKC